MAETKFHVGMTCGGCSSAVNRILNKVEGVQSVDTNLEAKTVVVQHDASVTPDQLLAKLKKWGDASGKTVELSE